MAAALGQCEGELPMGQGEGQVLVEVLREKKGPFLAA
jgi:hypothetical protein